MSRIAQNAPFKRTADTLEVGDVILLAGDLVVITESSDEVATVPCDGKVNLPSSLGGHGGWPIPAKELCEPYYVMLGKTGRMTHEGSYFLARNSFCVDVVGFLDVELRGSVPEPHPDAP